MSITKTSLLPSRKRLQWPSRSICERSSQQNLYLFSILLLSQTFHPCQTKKAALSSLFYYFLNIGILVFSFLCPVILAFVFSFVVSFLGSMPPGPSNLAVFHMALNKHSKAGFWMAFGASLPELPYSFLAVLAIQYVSAFQSFSRWLEVAAMIVLLTVGTYILFFQKEKNLDDEDSSERWRLHPFWKGMLVAIFNPLLVGFWLVVSQLGVSLKCLNVHDPYEKVGFVMGTSAGAFCLLLLVVFFTDKIRQNLSPKFLLYVNKGIGGLFFALGIVQAVKSYLS